MDDNEAIQALKTQVIEGDERARAGRVARLAVLQSEGELGPYPCPALAHEYFEEARLCWYVGAFVAAILMSQLAFEELLRSHYRVSGSVRGKLDSGRLVDRAGFADLIDQGESDGFLSISEAHELRSLKDCRNPYVHAKDTGGKGPTFLDQLIKFTAPELVGLGVQDEARKAIELLVTLFPVLGWRM